MSYSHPHIPLLDILRGFAISGLIFTNILALGGYWDAPTHVQLYFAQGPINQLCLFINDVFIRYKFYTLFSFLFGIGFSILFMRAQHDAQKNFVYSYLLRLFVLFMIGWVHALFFLDGDILRIYAIAGLVMLCFRNLSNQKVLLCSLVALCIPVVMGLWESLDVYYFNPAVFFPYSHEEAIASFQYGPWRDFISSNYDRTLNYLADNLTSRRFFKIVGLFLLGFYVGRKQFFHHLEDYMPTIQRILPWAWGFSLTTNIIYGLYSHLLNPVEKELLYIISVYPMAFTYVITAAYLCAHPINEKRAAPLAMMGRMSLSNFLLESILAGFFMLWYGLGLAVRLHVSEYYWIAFMIVSILFIFSHYYLKYFNCGPLEYLMRKVSFSTN